MTYTGAPRITMRSDYEPTVATLKRWRAGQTYETALGYLMRWIALQEDGCWIWQGTRNHHGYGAARHWQFDGSLAHRFGWFVFHGDVPDGLTLDHLCRVRACVNPAHLEPVTTRENLARSPLTRVRAAS